jgi:hypothetical protein
MHIHFDSACEAIRRAWGEATLNYLSGENQCAKFVFDEYPPDGMLEFGLQLVQHEAFHLPFPSSYFEWTYMGNTQGVLSHEADGRLTVITVGTQDGKWGCGIPLRGSLEAITENVRKGRIVQDKVDDGIADKVIETAYHNLFACCALLSSKGVEKDIVEPAARINQRRAKLNRPPLPAYTVIRLARARRENGEGTHASPSPHFRRGHVRRLAEDKLTVVRPHFVMADPGALPVYKVKTNS